MSTQPTDDSRFFQVHNEASYDELPEEERMDHPPSPVPHDDDRSERAELEDTP